MRPWECRIRHRKGGTIRCIRLKGRRHEPAARSFIMYRPGARSARRHASTRCCKRNARTYAFPASGEATKNAAFDAYIKGGVLLLANPVDYDTRDGCTRLRNQGAFLHPLFLNERRIDLINQFLMQHRPATYRTDDMHNILHSSIQVIVHHNVVIGVGH